MTYFIYQKGQQQGPFTLEQLQTMGINADTPVWAQGFANWTKAGNVAELQDIIIPAPPVNGFDTTPPPYPQASQYAAQSQPYGYAQQGYAQQQRTSAPPMPSTWLAWAIVATLLCCLPFGIVAIVYAAKVESLYNQGRYEEAENASRKARAWTIASAVTSLVIVIIYVIIAVLYGIEFHRFGDF